MNREKIEKLALDAGMRPDLTGCGAILLVGHGESETCGKLGYICASCKLGAELEALRRAIVESKEDGWLPFDTAPKTGEFLVYLDDLYLRSTRVQVMVRRPNVSFIGGSFAFDAPNPIYWQPLPKDPKK